MRYGVVQKKYLNDLARLFYRMMGYHVEENYDFSKAKHPTEKMVWQQAEISQEFWLHRLPRKGPGSES